MLATMALPTGAAAAAAGAVKEAAALESRLPDLQDRAATEMELNLTALRLVLEPKRCK